VLIKEGKPLMPNGKFGLKVKPIKTKELELNN
jgi:hypothetical protein